VADPEQETAERAGGGPGGKPTTLEVPVLPLRDVVAFPQTTRSFNVGRARSIRMIESLPAVQASRMVALALQRNPADEDPPLAALYEVGTLAQVVHVARSRRDGMGYLVVVATHKRLRLLSETAREPYLRARVETLDDLLPRHEDPEYLGLRDSVKKLFAAYIEKAGNIANEVMPVVAELEDAAILTDVVSATLPSLETPRRQTLLETLDVRERMRMLVEELIKENDKLDLERRLQDEIRRKVQGAQRDLLLREQLRAIQRELGEGPEGDSEIEALRKKADAAGLPEGVRAEVARELDRLRQTPSGSPEQTVVRNYLDWLVNLPWSRSKGAEIDLARAEQILDEDHYGLSKVKQRILEYLAVLRLRREIKGPILCFVGPPGVGKTSLGRSIARALGRDFARLSLGGMSDEAELRGHRRTYVGAMPGQIIQALRRAGSNDPVIMLDEVDKLARDFRGDPGAALLEILDPEQNSSFRDRYLDQPFDLSKVLFITTANQLDPVRGPLLDRMEVLELAGYSEDEKVNIARRYLVPKQVRENGLAEEQIQFSEPGLHEIIRFYTREAGVRGLERQIGAVARKHARRVLAAPQARLLVTPEVVRAELGPRPYRVETEVTRRTDTPGVATGLAWTPTGGDVLFVEATRIPQGRGNLLLTGQLGEVMQESTRAALTWLRAHGRAYGIDPRVFRTSDLHVHVPAGAVPKDGPSAGVVMAAALASALTGRRVRPDLAMTGEITLSGHVLPVGGIRDKILAARRAGIYRVALPEQNEVNVLEDLPPELRREMTFVYLHTVDDALDQALAPLESPTLPTDGGTAHHAPPPT
jgi:ATP-dependent Lon protease